MVAAGLDPPGRRAHPVGARAPPPDRRDARRDHRRRVRDRDLHDGIACAVRCGRTSVGGPGCSARCSGVLTLAGLWALLAPRWERIARPRAARRDPRGRVAVGAGSGRRRRRRTGAIGLDRAHGRAATGAGRARSAHDVARRWRHAGARPRGARHDPRRRSRLPDWRSHSSAPGSRCGSSGRTRPCRTAPTGGGPAATPGPGSQCSPTTTSSGTTSRRVA